MNEFDCFHGKFMKLDVSEKNELLSRKIPEFGCCRKKRMNKVNYFQKKISCSHGKFLNLGACCRNTRMKRLIVFTENCVKFVKSIGAHFAIDRMFLVRNFYKPAKLGTFNQGKNWIVC